MTAPSVSVIEPPASTKKSPSFPVRLVIPSASEDRSSVASSFVVMAPSASALASSRTMSSPTAKTEPPKSCVSAWSRRMSKKFAPSCAVSVVFPVTEIVLDVSSMVPPALTESAPVEIAPRTISSESTNEIEFGSSGVEPAVSVSTSFVWTSPKSTSVSAAVSVSVSVVMDPAVWVTSPAESISRFDVAPVETVPRNSIPSVDVIRMRLSTPTSVAVTLPRTRAPEAENSMIRSALSVTCRAADAAFSPASPKMCVPLSRLISSAGARLVVPETEIVSPVLSTISPVVVATSRSPVTVRLPSEIVDWLRSVAFSASTSTAPVKAFRASLRSTVWPAASTVVSSETVISTS